MNGYILKDALLKYRASQEQIIKDAKEYAASAGTEESKNIRLETVELEVEMLNILKVLLKDYQQLELLIEDMNLKLIKFNPDALARKVICMDIGGSEHTFNYEFTKDTLRIKSEFGRLIQERYLWSDTFQIMERESDTNEQRMHE
jgi:hypothetical protein